MSVPSPARLPPLWFRSLLTLGQSAILAFLLLEAYVFGGLYGLEAVSLGVSRASFLEGVYLQLFPVILGLIVALAGLTLSLLSSEKHPLWAYGGNTLAFSVLAGAEYALIQFQKHGTSDICWFVNNQGLTVIWWAIGMGFFALLSSTAVTAWGIPSSGRKTEVVVVR